MEYAVYWLIALVVLLVIEAATLGLATIWFAAAADCSDRSYVRSRICNSDGLLSCCIADTSDFYTSCSRPFPE